MLTLKSFMKELDMLLRAYTPLISVRSTEEERARNVITEAAASRGYGVRYWSIISGFVDPDSTDPAQPGLMRDPQQDLVQILSDKGRCVYIMQDLHPWLRQQNPMSPVIIRTLKEVAAGIVGAKTIVLLGAELEVPAELEADVVTLDLPRPDRELMSMVLEETVEGMEGGSPEKTAEMQAAIQKALDKEALVSAGLGLTAKEAQNCYLRGAISTGFTRIPSAVVKDEKKRIIERSGVLKWVEPEEGLDFVAGLDVAKDWLLSLADAFGQEAIDYGLDPVKGMLSFGKPGCGKSLLAKLAGCNWGVPILQLEIDSIKDMYQGKSQRNMRDAFNVADAVSPCVLYIDEFDKVVGSMGGSSAMTDGGTGQDLLSMLLGYMQDKTTQVFIAGAANRGRGLPSEILRKGRFDMLWLVDLPNIVERAQIFDVHLKKRKRDPDKFDLEGLAAITDQFTGAEIEACVVQAMRLSFNDKRRPLETDDIRVVVDGTTPQSAAPEIAKDLEEMRDWAKAYCTPASTQLATASKKGSKLGLRGGMKVAN